MASFRSPRSVANLGSQSRICPAATTHSLEKKALILPASVRLGSTTTFNGLLCPPVFPMPRD